MDAIYAALFTIFMRGGIAILLVIGGIYALYIGLKVFNSKAGVNKDAATIELGPFKANTKTIGSFVMVTACFWGYLSVQVSPTYKTEQLEVALNTIGEMSDRIEALAAVSNDMQEIPLTIRGVYVAPDKDMHHVLLMQTQEKGPIELDASELGTVYGAGGKLTLPPNPVKDGNNEDAQEKHGQ